MGMTKRLDLSAEGLSGFIVTFHHPGERLRESMHFWAEDVAHAGEQTESAEPEVEIDLIETVAEYEARTGEIVYED
jgi:hypothetical protein